MERGINGVTEMKDETYYLKKYLLLCDMITNKRDELNRSFDGKTQIDRIVRSTSNIFCSIVDESKRMDP